MRITQLGIAAALMSAVLPVPLFAKDVPAPRQVNITAGSTPGWIPSEALEIEAIATWESYFEALEKGEFETAWGMLSPALQGDWPLDRFIADQTRQRETLGSVTARDRIKITWTKDAPSAPEPGTYVAIDAHAKFQRAQRQCGFMIVHRAPDARSFTINRIESAILDDATFDHLSANNSPLQAELVWQLVSRSCPNYTPSPLPDSVEEGVEFATVAETRTAVAAREGIEQSAENGWTIMADRASKSIWSFSPSGSPFHPSVIKRAVIENLAGDPVLKMSMRCEVDKALCDALYVDMAARNGLIPVKAQ